MTGNDGYGYEPEALRTAASKFAEAAADLEKSDGDGDPPDCGHSSEIVADAMGMLFSAATLGAGAADEIGDRIDAAKGSYDDIENTNEGDLKVKDRMLDGDLPSDETEEARKEKARDSYNRVTP